MMEAEQQKVKKKKKNGKFVTLAFITDAQHDSQ